MASPDNAFQAGIFNRLAGFATLTSAIGSNKVFDFVPQGTASPFVRIGEFMLSDWDTKSKNGWEITFNVHVWSILSLGTKTVNSILSLIHDALHQQEASITVSGFTLVQIRREDHLTIQDPSEEGQNDQYYHGVARYRAIVHA